MISQSEYDAALANYEVANAEVDAAKQTVASAEFAINSAKATLREAKDNLTKTSVSAPRNGTVSKLNVEKVNGLPVHRSSLQERRSCAWPTSSEWK